jgi:hypothetical protein
LIKKPFDFGRRINRVGWCQRPANESENIVQKIVVLNSVLSEIVILRYLICLNTICGFNPFCRLKLNAVAAAKSYRVIYHNLLLFGFDIENFDN